MENSVSILGEIVSISAGYAFRTSIKSSDTGVSVIQMKDVSLNNGLDWTGVILTELPGRRPSNWIENNDLLFLARGNHNYSVCIQDVFDDTVCTPHFFHIRIKDHRITPEFLNWQINQLPAQKYFDSAAEGQAKRNIRRAVLESLPIVLPSIPKQKQIVDLSNLINEERRIYTELANNRAELMGAIAIKLHEGADMRESNVK